MLNFLLLLLLRAGIGKSRVLLLGTDKSQMTLDSGHFSCIVVSGPSNEQVLVSIRLSKVVQVDFVVLRLLLWRELMQLLTAVEHDHQGGV